MQPAKTMASLFEDDVKKNLRKRPGTNCTMPEPWLTMVKEIGTVAKLAAEFNVTPMQIWRWAHGRQFPHFLQQPKINDWCRARGIPLPFEE
jgi:hypothetical protein